jgi:uncharacterized protein YkwD
MKKFFLTLLLGTCSLASIPFTLGEENCGGYGYQACIPQEFTDTKNHTYQEAINYVREKGIVKGYVDGTFKPDSPINRAEFTKILVEAILGTTLSESSQKCFPDVDQGIWFEKYVCYAKKENILKGYPDGSYQPINNINFAEAAKILVNTFDIPHREAQSGEEWHVPFVVAMEEQKSIPGTIQKTNHNLTRGEMAEMMMRLKKQDKTRSSLKACDLIIQLCPDTSFSGYGDELISKVDMQKVRVAWLAWNNSEREKLSLHAYKYNNALNRTAYLWSKYSQDKGEMSHKREGQTEYYDYDLILQWFQNLGVDFVNVNRVTFTENIGWGPYSCSESDCTQKLIDNIRSTFDFYMAEKDKEYKPHYNSLMNKYFNVIGLGISVGNGKYYLTVHYGTELK